MNKKIKAILAVVSVILVVSILAACSSLIPQSKQLIGTWADSTNTCGYEFKNDGTVKITFANVTIPIININYDGTVDGVYTTTEDEAGVNHLTITYTILTKSISQEYTYNVEKSALTLTNSEGNVTTFIKQTASTTTAATSTTAVAAQ